jgi:ParB-like nuclease domain
MARAASVKRKPKQNGQIDLRDLTMEQWPIERLRGYPGNPRKNEHAVDRMCQAIREFGFRIPIVAKSDGLIVDGHLRLKAAIKIGLKTVPIALADDLTENQIKAFRLLANQSSSWAEWDMPLLKIELEGLKLADYPLELTGFEQVQLVSFLSGISDPNAEWRGMPEFDQKDKSAFRTIPIHFKDQNAVDKFAKLVKAKITEDTRYLWFPEIEIETYADKRYKGKK